MEPIFQSSRAIIYTEGFESTTGSALPTGWISTPANVWVSLDSVSEFDQVGQRPDPNGYAHTGRRCMGRGWTMAGRDAWAISAGFELTAGVGTTVSFWFLAPGYINYGEYDDFEVRIGKTPNAAAMKDAPLVFSNIENLVPNWTLAEGFFIPDASATYYLGFHDLNTGDKGIYILVDDIEVATCLCCPVIDFEVKYNNDCNKAELTWKAPGVGIMTYKVFRDDEEIATVQTESYTDVDFEPTLEHSWTVKVVCGDGLSIAVTCVKEACITPSCISAKNVSVEYNDKCDETMLTWNEPTEILWDNTEGPTMSLYRSVRWYNADYPRNIIADDFDVPSGETWLITEVFFNGSHSPTSGAQIPPDYIGIEFFKDNGNKPGQQIYEDPFLIPLGGSTEMNKFMTLLLSTPVEIKQAGKYWVSCYGVHMTDADEENRNYYAGLCSILKGAPLCFLDDASGSEWVPNSNVDLPSMYFRIQGHKNDDPIEYNIYRDELLIESKITDLSFIDKTFDPTKKHTWSVRVACSAGDESAPIYGKLENCKEDNAIDENSSPSFSIVPNPANNKITITAENHFNKIEVINFLGQTVIAHPYHGMMQTTFDISNLNSGVYFVRLMNENGTNIQKFIKQ
jgi:hypothetical protein